MDKIIISNRTAMTNKYSAGGLSAVDTALQRLVAADRSRGLSTAIVNIDDSHEMASYGASSIVNSSDERGTKAAVDAICSKVEPDYIVLLDGPDVVPHVTLDQIDGLSDLDQTIESDLPYACNAGFSRKARSYLAVTRVVGRLPMARGDGDANRLVGLLDRCRVHAPRQRNDLLQYFAISADVWAQSTQLSVSAIFGQHNQLQLSPQAGHPAIDQSVNCLAHFINCHGADADPRFYGQQGTSYPIAMESSLVAPNIKPGTVAAAECCYGARLYDPALTGQDPPICMSYLLNGALAFVGSTTIAYGPNASNAQADLITQYFLEDVLQGASTGRAFLQARQRFVRGQRMSGATNLKTLAQFVLYGDPSLVAIDLPAASKSDAGEGRPKDRAIDENVRRKLRRATLKSAGVSVGESATYPFRRTNDTSAALKRARALAKNRGFSGPPAVFSVTGGASFRDFAKVMQRKPMVAVFVEKRSDHHDMKSGLRLPAFHVLVAHMMGDAITAVEQSESR